MIYLFYICVISIAIGAVYVRYRSLNKIKKFPGIPHSYYSRGLRSESYTIIVKDSKKVFGLQIPHYFGAYPDVKVEPMADHIMTWPSVNQTNIEFYAPFSGKVILTKENK